MNGAPPNTVSKGFNLDDVKAGKYGRQLHFWDWKGRKIKQSIDLGENGMIPLEVRFHHDPDSVHGFVGAALSSTMWHWFKKGDKWEAEKVISVESVETEGWPFPVPGLITDLVLSMDDKYLYFSNWLHGDLRQYDVSDPANPKLTGQLWLGGVIARLRRCVVKSWKVGLRCCNLASTENDSTSPIRCTARGITNSIPIWQRKDRTCYKSIVTPATADEVE